MFGPRVRDLGDRARTLTARRDELEEAAYIATMDPPAQADLGTLRSDLEDIITHGTDARRKAAVQAFVHRLVVVEPGVIQPTCLIRGGLPTDPADNPGKTAPTSASRAVTDLVRSSRLGLNCPDRPCSVGRPRHKRPPPTPRGARGRAQRSQRGSASATWRPSASRAAARARNRLAVSNHSS